MKSSRDSMERSRLTRRTATVTISAPEASRAAWVSGPLRYLPVPTMRRDWKALPAMTRGSIGTIVELGWAWQIRIPVDAYARTWTTPGVSSLANSDGRVRRSHRRSGGPSTAFDSTRESNIAQDDKCERPAARLGVRALITG